jgi:hypothetical protein
MELSRRRVLRRVVAAAGAAGVAAAVDVAGARPAGAAAGGALLLGRSNDAQNAPTWLYTTVSGIGVGVVQNGSGVAGQFLGTANDGVVGLTRAGDRWGVHGTSLATSPGSGGAVRAEGGPNTGLFADTDPAVHDVPALIAVGGDGAGTAQVARGTSYLDGDACLLRAWVGVGGTSGERLAYAPLVSGERAQHTTSGRVALPSSGTATVTLPATFLAACDEASLVVMLTPIGLAMSGLYVTTTSTGFVVKGGLKGSVFWTATANRTVMDLPRPTPAAAALSGQQPQSAQQPLPQPLPSPPTQPQTTRSAAQRFRRATLRF